MLLGRSERLPVALLGTLAAGAVYVPLDPSYPAERLRLMGERAGLAAIVADRPLPPGLDRLGAPVVDLARADCAPGARPRPVRRAAADLAYVMFPSGSTGDPKGVMIEPGP